MLIPIRDEKPPKQFPVVTATLIALNLVVYLWDRGGNPFGPSLTFAEMTMVPKDVVAAVHGKVLEGVLPVFTSLFLHGGIAHILGNMWFLWIFGNNIEDTFGPVKFVLLYFFWGVCAAALHIFVVPNSGTPTLGASGAIAGILGAYIMLFPRARIETLLWAFIVFIVELPAYVLLGFWFILQVIPGYQPSNVATWAHTGGFVAGVATVLVLGGRSRILGLDRRPSVRILADE